MRLMMAVCAMALAGCAAETGGEVVSGDMPKKSTGLCNAVFDPASGQRWYACTEATSDECFDNTDPKRGAYRYICPAPNLKP
jgi:hypothetical protein